MGCSEIERGEMNDKESQRSNWEEATVDIDRECTCNDCGRNEICEFRYDLYNYDGDCLWLK